MKHFIGSLLAVYLISLSINAFAEDENTPFILNFSVKLLSKISDKEMMNLRKNKGPYEDRYLTYEIACERKFVNCSLTVFTMAGEYCNGKGKSDSLFTRGYDSDFIENPKITPLGKDKLIVKYSDSSLYGQTDNSLLITYKYMKYGGLSVVNVEGEATTLVSNLGTPVHGSYSVLDKPVYCIAGFYPPQKELTFKKN